jgi:hypothetical protein
MPFNHWQKHHHSRVTRSQSAGLAKRHKGLSTKNILTYGRTRKRVIRLGQGVCPHYPNHVFATALPAVYTVGRRILANGDIDVCFDRQRHPTCADIGGFAMTGSRTGDALAANLVRGFAVTPVGYTWHHKHDFAPTALGGTCTMQLVLSDCHNNIFHHGAVAQWNNFYAPAAYGP